MKFIRSIKAFFKESLFDTLTFSLFLGGYLVVKSIALLGRIRFCPAFLQQILEIPLQLFHKFNRILYRRKENNINRVNLIDLGVRNMVFKKSRTLVTIGGMAVGVAAVVFLVSLGYGLQDLVINRVASLDELNQVTIVPQQSSSLKITDETLTSLDQLSEVEKSLPVISLVGRVNYQNSVTDVAAYGVVSEYLKESAFRPVYGDFFESNEIVFTDENVESITERNASDVGEPLSYSDRIIAKVLGESNTNVTTEENVLGDTIELVDLEGESEEEGGAETEVISLSSKAKREAVVNAAMLNLLGISEPEAVGQQFEVSYIVVGSLLEDQSRKVESAAATYSIVGVIHDEQSPLFYVPFIDLRSIGITNYSEVRSVIQRQDELAQARQKIEAMGFTTASVVDTLDQIDSLFASLRFVLGLVGMVAVAIAALGMFNTLTVSLMERTREVGFMKALGMRSNEVKELFLAESILMGLFGGGFGLLLGVLGGKAMSLALTIYSELNGGEAIDISSTPASLIAGIVVLSIVVGFFTGHYPARRATKISALDALRYE